MRNDIGQFIKGSTPYNKNTKGVMIAWNKGIHWKEMPKKNCIECGAEFSKPQKFSKKQWDENVVCSKPCRVAYRKRTFRQSEEAKEKIKIKRALQVMPRGEKTHNWKGGTTNERRQAYHRIEYKLWRKAVFERDGYACKLCNIKGGELNADHIKPWAIYPDLRYDLNNGRTLCISCHRSTHTWGKRKSQYLVATQ